jgi:hypothetical protein
MSFIFLKKELETDKKYKATTNNTGEIKEPAEKTTTIVAVITTAEPPSAIAYATTITTEASKTTIEFPTTTTELTTTTAKLTRKPEGILLFSV